MNNVINVLTGDVKVASGDYILISSAIGSCIVVAVYSAEEKRGGMAHIMLPGKAPEKKQAERLKYAEDALEELLGKLHTSIDKCSHIEICLIGGGNVLKRADDYICRNNIASVLEILKRKKLKISAQALGGTKRRSVRFDVGKAEVYFTENSSAEMLLWKGVV